VLLLRLEEEEVETLRLLFVDVDAVLRLYVVDGDEELRLYVEDDVLEPDWTVETPEREAVVAAGLLTIRPVFASKVRPDPSTMRVLELETAELLRLAVALPLRLITSDERLLLLRPSVEADERP
jgi:hypothetical protein